jgi:uncharacterized OB-fold protein
LVEQPATAAATASGPLGGPLPRPKPLPVPDGHSAPFWEAARRHELALQRCRDCGAFQHPPGPVCRRCAAEALHFVRVSGRGGIFVPGFERDVPLAIALVAIEEQPDVRLLANLREVDADRVEVGMRVEVVFEDLPDGTTLPQFRPARA